jgi:Fur family iron response transcriptional regulator
VKKACLSSAEIEDRLESAGVRPTAQRIAVARFVLCEADHPTADEVKRWADKNFPKMSLATVYNTLGTLVAAGLLKELTLPHTDKTVYDDNVEEHHHFLDEKSGKIYDLTPEQVGLDLKLGRGFRIKGAEVVLRGEKA